MTAFPPFDLTGVYLNPNETNPTRQDSVIREIIEYLNDRQPRQRLLANTTFYVDPVNGKDTNPGTQALPVKTLTGASLLLATVGYDFNDITVTVQLVDGTYTVNNIVDQGFFLGTQPVGSNGSLVIQGNLASPGNVILDAVNTATDQIVISADVNYPVTVQGITFKRCASRCLNVQSVGGKFFAGTLVFQNNTGGLLNAEAGGGIELVGPLTFNGSMNQGVFCASGSVVDFNGQNITFGAGATCTGIFLNVGVDGFISYSSTVLSGTLGGAGSKFQIDSNGTLVATLSDETTLIAESAIPGGSAGVNFGGNFNRDIRGSSIGYDIGSGNGGVVTQLTNKGTAVMLNRISGQITMNSTALAGGASVAFNVNNSTVNGSDVVITNVQGNVSQNYTASVTQLTTGQFTILVTNESTSSASDALTINYAVIKATQN